MLRYLLELSTKNTVFAIEPHIGLQLAQTVSLMLDKQIPISGDAFGMQKIQSMVYRVSGSFDQGITEKRVKVIPIHGVMTMHGGMCSYGMIHYGRMIQMADNDSSIDAIVLDINTPGGEAMYTETLAQIVANTKKPVVTWVNQLTASAGYHFAAASDEIILSGKTAEIGSIGTLIHYLDFSRKLKNEGVDEVMISASKSTNKRKYNFSQPTDKDKKLIIEELLDPHNEAFIDDVKSFRPELPDEVFTGELYMGKKAVEIGLADLIGSLDFAITRAAELSDNKTGNSQSMNKQQEENNGLIQAIKQGVTQSLQKAGLIQKSTVTPVEENPVNDPAQTVETPEQADQATLIAQLQQQKADLEKQLSEQAETIAQQNEAFKTIQAEVIRLGNHIKGETLPEQSAEVQTPTQVSQSDEYVFPETIQAQKRWDKYEKAKA